MSIGLAAGVAISRARRAGERVSLVDEQDAVQRLLAFVQRLWRRLPDVAGNQTRAVGLHQMSFPQHVQEAIDFAERARDLCLADAGRTGEHHVQAHGGDRQILRTAFCFDLQASDQFIDLVFYRCQADHRIEVFERIFRGATRGYVLWLGNLQ